MSTYPLDEAVQRFDSMLRLSAATKGQRQSVFNWVAGNKPLVRSESACHLGCLDSKDYAVLGLDESEKAGMESVIDLIVKKFPAVANRVSTPSLDHSFGHPCNVANELLSSAFE